MSSKKKGLGKGLSALLESAETDITLSALDGKTSANSGVLGSIAQVDISSIETNPFQPRTEFEKEALIDLTNSIKVHGIIQPITLRKMGRGNYQIISGERRFRAAQLAGLTQVPCYIRVADDQTMLEMAIVENLQREDLNAIEIALSFKRLIDECNLTQEQLSEKVGKNRSTVTNYLRLLKLPLAVQVALRENKISMGHARALLSISDEDKQLAALETILEENLSVRKVEELVKEKVAKDASKSSIELTKTEKRAVESLAKLLDTKVLVTMNNRGKGKIVIDFKTDVEFGRILKLLHD
ncbi:MAG: chromosome partitioning protein ParB [Crocinitomicaceae bacterium]|nr:chromosome partitioning protein ParB [Crocinitomicaceae bacterium]